MKYFSNRLVTLAAAALMISLPLFAGGPLNLNALDPDGVERYGSGGVGIGFNRDLGGLGPLTNAAADTLVRDAFDAWELIPSATATYVDGGDLAMDVDETNFLPFIDNLFFGGTTVDGLSPIVYDEDGAIFAALFGPGTGVLGFASPDTRDAMGNAIESVCFLNGGAILGGFPLADFFGVTVHEFGHYSGLAHTVVNGQIAILGDTSGPTPDDPFGPLPAMPVETMYPFAIVGGGEDTPHLDDISIYSFLYPSATFFATVGSIGGTIFGVDGATPLTGVNVICRNPLDPFVDAASAISGDRGITGEWKIKGLTAGADYRCFTDEILAGGFSTTPLSPLPGPEEYYNGASESSDASTDIPSDFVDIPTTAGVHTTGIDIIFNAPGPGVDLGLGDDTSVEVPLPFTFSMCGQDFGSVFINSNGSLTFGFGDADFTESAAEHLTGPPRVAGLWDDLSPNNGGTVIFTTTPTTFTVSFDSVPEFFATGSNTFDIKLTSSNNVDLTYTSISATDGLAGVSCGFKFNTGSEGQVDLSRFTRRRFRTRTAAFEQFPGGTNDLDGLTVRLSSGTSGLSDVNEPNDSLASATPVSIPFNSDGLSNFTSIDPAGADVDYYSFSAGAGETIIAEVLVGNLDTVIGIFDSGGTLLATDDDGGTAFLSRIEFVTPAADTYSVAVSTFDDFDFDGDGFVAAGCGRYVVDIQVISGMVITLGDDDFEEVTLDFSFPFRGTSYGSVFVGSNGFLTFGAGDTDFSESVAELLSEEPRIAGLWDDLSPNQGGMIIADGDAASMTITFTDVPQFVAGDSNNFAFTLFSDGSVDIDYGDVSAADGIVGCTEGGGAADPGETDISGAAMPLSGSGTTYEQFTGGGDAFDLANTLIMFSP